MLCNNSDFRAITGENSFTASSSYLLLNNDDFHVKNNIIEEATQHDIPKGPKEQSEDLRTIKDVKIKFFNLIGTKIILQMFRS